MSKVISTKVVIPQFCRYNLSKVLSVRKRDAAQSFPIYLQIVTINDMKTLLSMILLAAMTATILMNTLGGKVKKLYKSGKQT